MVNFFNTAFHQSTHNAQCELSQQKLFLGSVALAWIHHSEARDGYSAILDLGIAALRCIASVQSASRVRPIEAAVTAGTASSTNLDGQSHMRAKAAPGHRLLVNPMAPSARPSQLRRRAVGDICEGNRLEDADGPCPAADNGD